MPRSASAVKWVRSARQPLLEVQVVDRIYDQEVARAFGLFEGQLLVSIHCGSRGLGHQIGTEYLVSLAKAASRLGIQLPDRELACAPINLAGRQEYLGAMNAAINVALANRQILTHLHAQRVCPFLSASHAGNAVRRLAQHLQAGKHKVEGKDRLLYIHRKGATRAFGPATRRYQNATATPASQSSSAAAWHRLLRAGRYH